MHIRNYILEQDKHLYKSKWHDIRITPDGFEYDIGVPGVAVLPFRYRKDLPTNPLDPTPVEFLLRKERNPQQPNKPATVITGRKDIPGENNLQVAIRELKEESGYLAPKDRFTNYGPVYIGKGSPTPDVFFAADITGIPEGEITTDGSDDEKLSSNFWVSHKEMREYISNSKCVYLNTAYSFWEKDIKRAMQSISLS